MIEAGGATALVVSPGGIYRVNLAAKTFSKLSEAELARSDIGSLNTVVLAEDDTTIERIDTLPSQDLASDPEGVAVASRVTSRSDITKQMFGAKLVRKRLAGPATLS